MDRIFNYDNAFFRAVNKIVDAAYVSILWILCSLPVITLGASTTALYYTVHHALRGSRGYIGQSFWSAFKSNFKQTTQIWLIMAGLFVLLLIDSRITYVFSGQEQLAGILYYFFRILMFFWFVWCISIFVYSATFENGIKDTIKNAGVIALSNLWQSIFVIVLLIAALLFVCLLPIVIIVAPAGFMYVYDLLLDRIFQKYMPKDGA